MLKGHFFLVSIICIFVVTGCRSQVETRKTDTKNKSHKNAVSQLKTGDDLEKISGLKSGTFQMIIGVDFGRKYSIHYLKNRLGKPELLGAARRICGNKSRQPIFISNHMFISKFSAPDPNEWEYEFECR